MVDAARLSTLIAKLSPEDLENLQAAVQDGDLDIAATVLGLRPNESEDLTEDALLAALGG